MVGEGGRIEFDGQISAAGGRGPEPNRAPSARQLPPPDPALRQRALAAMALGLLGLLGLALGLGNLRRGIYVAVLSVLRNGH